MPHPLYSLARILCIVAYSTLSLEVIETVFTTYTAFGLLVHGWGDPTVLVHPPWTLHTPPIMSGLSKPFLAPCKDRVSHPLECSFDHRSNVLCVVRVNYKAGQTEKLVSAGEYGLWERVCLCAGVPS